MGCQCIPLRRSNGDDLGKSALELIEELSKVCSDQTIGATLNRLGHQTGSGKTWRLHSVQNARYYHRLTNHRNTAEWLTIELAAKELQVSHTVIRRLIREGTLPATQVVPTTPWIIARSRPLYVLVLGRGFLWSDLLCYTAGVSAGWLAELVAAAARSRR